MGRSRPIHDVHGLVSPTRSEGPCIVPIEKNNRSYHEIGDSANIYTIQGIDDPLIRCKQRIGGRDGLTNAQVVV
eukprot:scaffold2661_cov507-Pavlova_lutheri.AAC.1